MPTIWGFDHIEEKHTLYRGKDCIKKFFTSSRKGGKNRIDFEKKNVIVNKRRSKITSTCKSMSDLWKKNPSKTL